MHDPAAMHAGQGQPTNARGQPVCGAKTRKSRTNVTTCQNTALGPPTSTGFRRCRMHNGFPAVGPLAPQATQGGRYSRHLQGKFRAVYEEATRDPAILSLRADVALLTARIEQALEGLDGGVSIGAAVTAWAGYEAATRSKEPGAIIAAADVMRKAMAALGDQRAAMRDIERLMLLKGRLSVAESKRQIAAATMLDAASAWALVSAIGQLVTTHVADPVARRAISEGLVRLTHRGALPRDQ